MRKAVFGIFTAAILISGCGGGGGSDSGGTTNTLPFPATLTDIQTNIFTPKCISCHQPGQEGVVNTQPTVAVPDSVPLDLSTKAAAYDSLVGPDGTGRKSVQSRCGVNDDQHCGLRVAPGDPDSSYMIHKLENTDISFATDPMPRNATPLGQDEINVIRQWIQDGALNN
jgi:hypothetical protein